MSSWLSSIGAITVFVADPQRSKEFYGRVFDLPVAFEDEHSVVFNFAGTLLNLLLRSQAAPLIAPALVAGSEAGAAFQFTIWVEDIDEVCSELAHRGVPLLNGVFDRPWGVRTATFTDPDGHIWEVAQRLS